MVSYGSGSLRSRGRLRLFPNLECGNVIRQAHGINKIVWDTHSRSLLNLLKTRNVSLAIPQMQGTCLAEKVFLPFLCSRHRLTKSLDAQSWPNLYTLEVTSNECVSKLRSLLSRPSEIAVARSFQGVEADTLANFLDQVSGPCVSRPQDTKGPSVGS